MLHRNIQDMCFIICELRSDRMGIRFTVGERGYERGGWAIIHGVPKRYSILIKLLKQRIIDRKSSTSIEISEMNNCSTLILWISPE